MANKSVWGIDIGQVALKAIRLAKNEQGALEVLAYEVIEHSKILSQPDVDAEMGDALIREALEKFVSRQDVLKSVVVTGLPGNQTFARFTKLPPVEPKQVPSIVEFEAGQQIPFPMEEVVWDYQTFQEPNSPDIAVGIFAIKREIVARHLAYYKTVSLNPNIIQMNPMALYNFAAFDGQLAEGGATVLVNVGADSTDLVIADGELLWQRTFPLGGNAFTTALVNSFKLSFTKAEALKRTSDQSKYGRQVFQAMKPAFSDILTEINKSVGFFSQMHRESQIKKFLLAGNTFKVPGLVQFLKQSLPADVVRVEHFGKIATGGLAATPGFAANVAVLAPAYGLALQGLGLAKIESNLLPIEQARQLLWQRKTFWFLSAAACLTLAGGLLWVSNTLNQKRYDDQAKSRNDYQAILAEAQAAKTKFDTVRVAGQDEVTRINRIESLQTPEIKAMVPKIYDVVIRSLPKHDAHGARSTEEYKALLAKDSRKQRHIILIDNLAIRYVPDFNPPEPTGAMPAAPVAGAEAGLEAKPPKPGFEVTIVGHSPYGDLNTLLASNYINNLQDLGNKATLPFSVDTSNPIKWTKKLEEQPLDFGIEIPGLPGGGTAGAMGTTPEGVPPAGAGQTSAKKKEFLDPLFQDEMKSDDSLFMLSLRVYIKGAGAPGSEPQPGRP